MTTTTITAALPRHTIALAFAVGMAAALASASRLLLRTPDAFTQMVWAEDGLFPLCVRKVGFLACFTDSFAGYLLAVPRGIAGIVSLLPLTTWPLATNAIALVLVGLTAGTAFVILRASGRSLPASLLVALLPAAAPIMGFETLGVIASAYTLLLFVTALQVACPPSSRRWSWSLTGAVAVALLLTALTIPSAIALAIGLLIQMVRRRIPRTPGVVLAAALAVGLLLQGLVILAADEQRSTTPTLGALNSLGQALPNAILTLLPGIVAGPTLTLDFPIAPPAGLGLFLASAMLIAALALLMPRTSQTRNAVGILLITGLVVLAVPTLTGYPNNRYFAAPILLWSAAGLIALDALVARSRRASTHTTVTWILTVLLMGYLWSSTWAVSELRGTVFPAWSSELARVTDECLADPNRQVVLQFSPGWPPPELALPEPTNAVVRCMDLRLVDRAAD